MNNDQGMQNKYSIIPSSFQKRYSEKHEGEESGKLKNKSMSKYL